MTFTSQNWLSSYFPVYNESSTDLNTGYYYNAFSSLGFIFALDEKF